MGLELPLCVEQSLFTYLKGLGLVLALLFVLYPAILIVQVLTGRVTESMFQITVLLILSVISWIWVIRLYRAYGSVDVTVEASE